MKGEINNNTVIVVDFNTTLTPMDRSTEQKIKKEKQTLNDTINQLDLIDIYITFHPKTMNFNLFSSAHGIFSTQGSNPDLPHCRWILHCLSHQGSAKK